VGCGLYVVNGTGGAIIHSYIGPVYDMVEGCIKRGMASYLMCMHIKT
jgi:hypothetical protein